MFPDHLHCSIGLSNRAVRIAQITDCHLQGEHGGKLLGMDTDASLAHVLDLVNADPPADLVLATGDLANHGSFAAYGRFQDAMAPISVPVFWLAGNHDDQANMEQVANTGRPLLRRIHAGAWQILLLDSTVPGEVGGALGDAELDLLKTGLQEEPLRPTLVCMHHHPVPIGCAWLDLQRVSDANRLFDLLDGAAQVRGLLCGHVHQAHDIRRGELLIMSSPSTCVQFAPARDAFGLDTRPPGYRWLTLHPDGKLETGVRRVEGVKFDFDRDSTGYL